VKVAKVPIPTAFGPAFEGERIRKKEMHVEFGGNVTPAFEFVTTVELDEIEDGVIEVVPKDVDGVKEGSALPLAIWVEVAGRKMQTDFEPILERQIHRLINCAEGIWHMGQRDVLWTRISRNAFAKGMRLKHYGEILHARFINEYPAIVDKVKVTIITDRKEVERRMEKARKIYIERNRRLATMTDESVDTFYSCLLCQSFAPNHVCIITPERLGLCGAYNWLDGRAAYEIDETGPNQPVKKGRCLCAERGIWEGINEYVYQNSHKHVDGFSAYSIMSRPMTSCGCFEAIVSYVPECNGVMVVHREHVGDTPSGMTFSTLAGMIGGGVQTPGFIGVGKAYLSSRKFLSAEGGISRLVWMPAELKKMIAEDFNARAKQDGVPDLLEKIADENDAISPDDIRRHLEKVGHPALKMPDMASVWAGADVEEKPVEEAAAEEKPAKARPKPDSVSDLLPEIVSRVAEQLKEKVTAEVKKSLVEELRASLLGEAPAPKKVERGPTAASKLEAVQAFKVPAEPSDVVIQRVTIGATSKEGGTRGRTVEIGGQNCLPFHHFEGTTPHLPVFAIEVFDSDSGKFSPEMRDAWGDLLRRPADMAKAAVEKHGADLISVRLEGTHPEKGAKTPDEALAVVRTSSRRWTCRSSSPATATSNRRTR
jgi:CO dehydrogenase/CO-methylating acetyl-CoA synthase complex beta subunit